MTRFDTPVHCGQCQLEPSPTAFHTITHFDRLPRSFAGRRSTSPDHVWSIRIIATSLTSIC